MKIKSRPAHHEQPAREWANVLTHGLGVLLCLAALPPLWSAARHHDAATTWGLGIFGASMLLMYLASTLYHSFRSERLKYAFKIADHISIYLLIGGTYTPFILLFFRTPTGLRFLLGLWLLIGVGVLFKLFFTGRFKLLSTFIYLALGWLSLFVLRPIAANMSWPLIYLLLAGGLCYTLGTAFYLWKTLPFHHAIWHVFVLGGSACHYWAIYEGARLAG